MPLLTQDEYNRIEHPRPYLYKINNKGQFLYYAGEKHSFDPNHEQWIKIKKLWLDFLEKTHKNKRIAFVEAGLPRPRETEKESILEAGGTGLIIHLASREGIEVYCPEPSDKYERGQLEKQYSKEEIQYYYFARTIAQWWRKQDPKPDFKDYISSFLDSDKRDSGWKDFDFSFENMKIIHKKLYTTNFDLNDMELFQKITTPLENTTITNKVCQASGEIREKYIVDKIFKYWNQGYSIFIEYGSSHAVIQEPLLRERLSK